MLAEIARERGDLTIRRRIVASDAQAKRLDFYGSPSIQVGGVDVFSPPPGAEPGLSCRVYATPDGFAGAPAIEDLRRAIAVRARGGASR